MARLLNSFLAFNQLESRLKLEIWLIHPGVLELGYIAVLEAAAERIKGSTPFAWTTSVSKCVK